MKVAGKVKLARREIYRQQRGLLQPGDRVIMDCGERLCVNPAHMVATPPVSR
jgi:hypothetical protein